MLRLRKVLIALLACWTVRHSSALNEYDNGPIELLAEKYRGLSNKGKFIAGATLGFIGTRIALKTAIGALKLGATVFITAEVLHFTGLLKELPALSEEQSNMIKSARIEVMRRVEGFRFQVRRRLNPESMQYIFDNERIGALGLASGAIVGTLI